MLEKLRKKKLLESLKKAHGSEEIGEKEEGLAEENSEVVAVDPNSVLKAKSNIDDIHKKKLAQAKKSMGK